MNWIILLYGRYPIRVIERAVPTYQLANDHTPATEFETEIEAVDKANELGLAAYGYEVKPADQLTLTLNKGAA